MIALLQAFSWSYARRHPLPLALTVIGVAVGVATFASVLAARQTLLGGLGRTIDRVAGRAQLQITGVGGVPESLLDQIASLDVVAAVVPTIEQVVTSGTDGAALLVVGVDLLADRRMRDYGFDGPTLEWDDPLEFLAQPDSIAVSDTFARRQQLPVGDAITITHGAATRRVVVRARLQGGLADAFGGRVALTDVYAAQELFGRGRRFDRLDLRLHDTVTLDEGLHRVRAAVPGYTVETPARRSRDLSTLVGSFVGSFDVSSGLAVLVGAVLVGNVLRISVERRRRTIGVMRALGAASGQLRGVVFVEAGVIGLLGSLIGLVLGWILTRRFLDLMSHAVRVTYGVGDQAPPAVPVEVAAAAVAIGIAAALAGAWMPARAAARVHPIDALSSGAFRHRTPPASRTATVLGVCLLAVPLGLRFIPVLDSQLLLFVTVISGTLATLLLAGPITWRLMGLCTSVLYRMAPVAGPLAVDALGSHPRRTSQAAAAVALALALVLGTGGYLHSFRTAFDRWLDNVVTADLVVRASADLAPTDQRLPADLGVWLLTVPGVSRADAYRVDWIPVHGETAMLASIDGEGFYARTRQHFTQGDDAGFLREVVRGDSVAISDNFARRYGVNRGDTLTIEAPTGPAHLRVAVVLDSYLSDRGLIMLDRRTYLRHWPEDSVSAYHVTATPGTPPEDVREAIQRALASRVPVLVSTRAEFRDEATSALEGFYALTRATIVLMALVALVGMTTSLLSGVVDRRHELGVLKAIGATGNQLRRSVVVEALVLSTTGLVLAVPLGALLARFLESVVADTYAGFVIPGTYPGGLLLSLIAVVPVLAAGAAWHPAAHAVRLATVQVLRHD